jgi:hypothetical protein
MDINDITNLLEQLKKQKEKKRFPVSHHSSSEEESSGSSDDEDTEDSSSDDDLTHVDEDNGDAQSSHSVEDILLSNLKGIDNQSFNHMIILTLE